MKIDNKGFAFSTLLYGTLALITLILIVILNISKNASNEMYYYSSAVEKDLNNCIYEEMALENCYSSGNQNCDATSYHACLGISDNQKETKGEIISTTLKKKEVTSGNGLYSDENIANRYVYRGTDVNNFIKYNNINWRIVSIEPNGTVKIAQIDYANKFEWDKEGSDEWQSSSLKAELNGQYYNNLQDTSKIINYTWNAARIYPSKSLGNLTIKEFLSQQEEKKDDTTSNAYVGLLSIQDYGNASLNNGCRSELLTSTSCNSWISQYKSWLINTNGEKSTNEAYYFSNDNKISLTKTSSNYNIIPVVVLNRNNVILGGDGTYSSPYLLK